MYTYVQGGSGYGQHGAAAGMYLQRGVRGEENTGRGDGHRTGTVPVPITAPRDPRLVLSHVGSWWLWSSLCPQIANPSLMRRGSAVRVGYSSLKRTAGSSLWDRAVRTLSNFS